MAVTTGKDTGTTSTGGGSGSKSPDSGRGSGGPGGGSLSAPNRTDPSKGATASKAAPSSAPGKTDKEATPSRSAPSSVSTAASTEPTKGITSRTPSQQAAVDKAKQNATQYGGAQTSTRAALTSKAPAQSAKVTDPSRGITSPMSGQGTSYKTPEAAKKANDKYTDTNGFYNRAVKGMPSAAGDIIDKRGQMGPFKGPGVGDFEGWDYDPNFRSPFNPNSPYTRRERNLDKRNARDYRDAEERGLKGIDGIDDDLRTPQEVRETVQRRIDHERGLMGQQVRDYLRGQTTGMSPDAKVDALKGRLEASRAVPDISLDPARRSAQQSILSGANSLLGNNQSSWSEGITAPGRTDRQTPQTTAPGRSDRQTPQTTAPGREDRATPQTSAPGKATRSDMSKPAPSSNITTKGNLEQSVAAGKTSNPAATNGSATAGPWGGTKSPTATAAKTDRQATPSVARPTQESFIDSLVNSGPAPAGAFNATGSILGMQPTAPSLGQVIARDPITYGGPRAGTTPAQPSTPVDVNANPVGEGIQQQMIAERVLNAMKQAAMADPRPPGRTRGVGDFFNQSPAPTSNLLDKRNPEQSVAPGKVSMPGPTMPAMPTDPRLALMQDQFQRMKAARGQIAAPQTVAPGRTDPVTPQTTAPGRQNLGDVVPTSAPPAATPPADYFNIQRTPGSPLAGNALWSRDLLGMMREQRDLTASLMRHDQLTAQQQAPTAPTAPAPQTVAPGRTDPEMPQDVPSGPLSSGRSVDDVLQEIALAEAAVNNLGMEEISEPVGPSRAPTEVDSDGYPQSVPPSQDGNYPPDDNFLQNDGQPQDLGELSNRYDYEKARAKEGLTQLAGRLFNAITSGDIRGFTPETNDKRAEIPPSERQKKNPAPRMDQSEAVAVARLLALVKLLEQQGTSQQQADLVNSTFI